MPRNAVLRVGKGRGFVVNHRNYLGHREPIIITAAHCLPFVPPCHPARYLKEQTYERLLGALNRKPSVWATCLFVDPIADIAVLGSPDSQEISDEADAYHRLMDDMEVLAVADAPKQGIERVPPQEVAITVSGERQVMTTEGFERPTPGKGPARVLSLDGQWLDGQVRRRSGWLGFEPKKLIASGMSGSPILNADGAAIAVVSVDCMCPVIVDSLSAQLVRDIKARRYIKARR
jgi:Trypsin-like peptidase domain